MGVKNEYIALKIEAQGINLRKKRKTNVSVKCVR